MPDTRNDNYSIIPHTSRPQVLLLHEDSDWTLPRHNATIATEINAAMQAQLGFTTTVLACVYDRYKYVEMLKTAGCPDQGLRVLLGLYNEILAATPFLHLDEPKGLPRSEYEQLLAFTPQLEELCSEMATTCWRHCITTTCTPITSCTMGRDTSS